MKLKNCLFGMFLFVAALPAGAGPGGGSTYTWNNTSGGDWSVAANWFNNTLGQIATTVPGAFDTALITTTGNYTVTVNSTESIGALTMGSSSGDGTAQKLSVSANFAVSGAITGTAQGNLSVTGGTTTLSGGLTGANVSSAGTLTLNGAGPWQPPTLSISAGTLDGTATLVAVQNTGGFTWTGGAIGTGGGSTIGVSCAGGSISGQPGLDGGQFSNSGALSWNGDVLTGQGSVINNSGTITITSTASASYGTVADYGGTRGIFNNTGTLTATLGPLLVSGTATIGDVFNNSGPGVNVEEGALVFGGGGTESAPFAVSAGATLNFSAGTFSFSGSSSSITGAGNLTISGGTVPIGASMAMSGLGNLTVSGGSSSTIGGSFYMGGTWTFSSGSVTMSGSTTGNPGAMIVSGGTVTFTGPGPWLPGALTISSGSLLGASPVAVQNTGGFTWTAGQIGNGAGNGGIVNCAGGSIGGQVGLDGGQLSNSGALSWNGDVLTGQGSIINNSGTITITSTASSSYGTADDYGGTRGVFNNTGTLTATLGPLLVSGTATIGDVFNNSGPGVNVEEGALVLGGGGTESAPFAVSAGATLNFSAGTFSFSGSSSSITGAGNLTISGGTVPIGASMAMSGLGNLTVSGGSSSTIGGSFYMGGTWTFSSGSVTMSGSTTGNPGAMIVSGGTVTFTGPGPWSPSTLNVSSGLLEGGSTVAVQNTGGFTWVAGQIGNGAGNGGIVSCAGGSIGGQVGLDGGQFSNSGQLALTGLILDGQGSVINNSGTITITSTASSSYGTADDYGGTRGVFNNTGTLTATLGPSVVSGTATIADVFNNSGAGVNVEEGALVLGGGGTESAPFAVSAGATLNFSGGTFSFSGSSSSITGAGNLTISGGTVPIGASMAMSGLGNLTVSGGSSSTIGGSFYMGGTWTFSSGSVTMSGSTTGNPGAMIVSGATVTFTGPGPWLPGALTISSGSLLGASPVAVQNTGGFTWTAGQIGNGAGNGGIVNCAGGSIGGQVGLDGGQLSNSGALSWNGDVLTGQGSIINNSGTITITSTASSSYGTAADYGGTRGVFNNTGTLTATGAVTGTATIGDVFNNTAGTVNVNGGTLNLGGGGSETGGFTMLANCTLNLSGLTFSFSSAASLTGAGNLTVSGAAATIGGSMGLTGTWTFSSGSANFTSSTTANPAAMVISGGTADFTGPGPWLPGALNLSSGALLGTSVVAVQNTGGLTWTGGQIGNGAVNGGIVTCVGGSMSGQVGLDGGQLSNSGALSWNGDVLTGQGSIINNSGTITITSTASSSYGTFDDQGGTRGVFNNTGTLTATGAASGTVTIGDVFNNTAGTVNVNGGTLALGGGGTETGGFTMLANCTNNLNGGSFAFNSGSSISGLGTWTVSGATASLTANASLTASAMDLTGGSVTLNTTGTLTPGTFNFSNGTLLGTSTLAVQNTGGLTWTGGQIGNGAGNGGIVSCAGGSISGQVEMDGGQLSNSGALSWNGDVLTGQGSMINNSGTITITSTANSGYGTVAYYGGTRGVFNNTGALTAAGAASGTATIADTFNNTAGAVNVNGGTLTLSAGGTETGSFAIAANCTNNLSSGTISFTSASSLTGAGDLAVNGATANFNNNPNLTGLFTISAGAANFNGSGTATLGSLTISGGTLAGSAPISVTSPGGFYWAPDTGTIESAVTINGGELNNPNYLDGGQLINTGVMTWITYPYVQDGAVISNAGTGTINFIMNGSRPFDGNQGGTVAFYNAGQFIASDGGSTASAATTDAFTNTGVFTVNSGTFQFNGAHDLSAGTLNFGISNSSTFGSVFLTGPAKLAGTLSATFNNGFVPAVGNSWQVLTYTSLSGSFTNTNLPAVATWQVTAGSTALTIQVLSLVPEAAWPTPAPIAYGTALTGAQLDASSTLAGSFTYNQPLGTILPAGTQTLTATFYPQNTSLYSPVAVSTTIIVQQAPLTVTANNTSKTYGQTVTFAGTEFTTSAYAAAGDSVTSVTLTSGGASASASVNGSPYNIVPSAAAGTGVANYNITYANGKLTVTKATPVITWANPANIIYPAALTSVQLDATVNVPGSPIVYNPPVGTVLNGGEGQTLMASFTPSDTADYNNATAQALINVLVCDIAPSGLVSWWKGDGNTFDVIGGNTGTAEGGLTYAPGEVGQAFNLDGSTGYVMAPAAANLNVGLGAGLTIEGWINPTSTANQQPIVEWNNGSAPGTHFWISVPGTAGNGPGCLYANLVDTAGAGHYIASAPGLITAGSFQHVAVTYDTSSGVAALYLNGTSVAQQNLGVFTPQTSYNVYLGYRPAGDPVAYFGGLLDEISIYNRPLAETEIQGIYNAGSVGKCIPPITITWPAPADITYGTVLGGAQLDAAANVAGNFEYPQSGTVLPAGQAQTLSVTFTATDTVDYPTPVTQTVQINVDKAPLTVTANPASRNYGAADPVFHAAITGFVNNDPASVVSGTAAFTSSDTAASPAGDNYSITPSLGSLTAANYTFGPFDSGVLTINPLPVNLSGTRTYDGTAAASASILTINNDSDGANLTLSGSATLAAVTVGAENITSFSGLTLGGSAAINYTLTDASGSVAVTKATPVITWATPAGIVYPAPLTSVQLDASANVPGAPMVYTPSLGTELPAGLGQTLKASFTPSDTTDYNDASATVLINVYTCDPAPSGLVSWWPGDGNALDIIGANNGTIENGVTFGPGEDGEAFDFNGSSGYVQVGGSYSITGSRTIEGWVYPNSSTGLGLPIFVVGPGGAGDFFGIAGTTGNCSIGGNYAQYELYVDHWGNPCYYDGGVAVTPNAWNHIALTYDGSSTLTFYVNGVAGPSVNGSLYNYNINTATIGGNIIGGSTTGASFNGLINQLSFYDRALAPAEIAAIYNAGAAGKCVPAVAIAWPTPADITYGTALSGAQLNAMAAGSLPGAYVYSPPLNTVLPAGQNQTLLVTFTATDTADYPSPVIKEVTINVDKAPLTVTANPASRVYNAADPAFHATITGFVNNDPASVVSGAPAFASSDTAASPAGDNYSITPSLGSLTAANYSFGPFDSGVLTINPLPVNLSGTRPYDGTAAASASILTINNDLDGANVTLSGSATLAGSSLGAHAITSFSGLALGGSAANNYTFSGASGSVTITKATPVVTLAPTASQITYGQALSASVLSGGAASTSGNYAFTSPSTVPPAGTASQNLIFTPADTTDYNTVAATASVTVAQAVLTVTDNQTMDYRGTVPALAPDYNGFVNNENASVLGGTPALSLAQPVTSSSPVGTYTIDVGPGSLSDPNYSYNCVNGTLTVALPTLTITGNDATMTYGGTPPALTFSYSGLVDGDTINSLTTQPTVENPPTSLDHAGPYTVNWTGAVDPNYTIVYVPGTVTISPAPLTLTASAQEKVYGQSLDLGTTSFTTQGLLNGDYLAGAALTASGSPAGNSAGAAVGGYTITPSAATGTLAANYAITYETGTLTVNQAQLLITANSFSKYYNETYVFAGTEFTSQGLQNRDTIGSVTFNVSGTPPGTSASAPVGPYTITPSAAAGGTFAPGNYMVSYAPGTLTVVPIGAPPSITSVQPAAGPTTGGTTVTIVGTGFEPGATVSFGGAPATAVMVESATAITANSPGPSSGTVNVTVNNPDGNVVTATGAFTYGVAPSVTGATPSSQNPNQGATVQFQVSATGDPTLSYRWQFNGANLLEDSHTSGTQTTALTINNVGAGDDGNYRCVVSNPYASVPSANATLSVVVPPTTITVSPPTVGVGAGGSASFSVSANGTSPTYSWYQNSVLVGAGSTFNVLNVQGNASYTVTAANAAGSVSAPATVTLLNYCASAQASQSTYPEGSAGIPINVQSFNCASSAAAQNDGLVVWVYTAGNPRSIAVTTDANGNGTATFVPLAVQVGICQYAVTLPGQAAPASPSQSFTIIGMNLSPASESATLVPGTPNVVNVQLNNLTGVPLSGIAANVMGAPSDISAQVSVPQSSLAGNANEQVAVTLTASDNAAAASGTISIQFTSSQGASVTLPISATISPPRAILATTPSALSATMIDGAQTTVTFTMTNSGGAATGPINVTLPSGAPWLAIGTAQPIASLAPDQVCTITLELTPASTLTVGPYSGDILIEGASGSVTVPFTFTAVSTQTGGLQVTVTDELTLEGQGDVAGATVTISDFNNGQVVGTQVTPDPNSVTFGNLAAGYYNVNVQSPDHDPYSTTVFVPPGAATALVAQTTYNFVQYSWTVTPTSFQDSYNFTLDTTFVTKVPWPVLTITPGSINMCDYSGLAVGDSVTVNLTVTNAGLIAGQSLALVLDESNPDWSFEPGFTSGLGSSVTGTISTTQLGDLPAESSITFPLVITKLGNSTDVSSSISVAVNWSVTALNTTEYNSTPVYVYNANPANCEVGAPTPLPTSGGGGGGGGGGFGGGGGGGSGSTPVNPVSPPPNYSFPPPASGAIVAVKLQIDQTAVITEQGFQATLLLANPNETAVSDLQVNIIVTDANGNPAPDALFIQAPVLTGINDVNGDGTLAPEEQGAEAQWLLIPTDTAAPTQPATYNVGGNMTYMFNGQQVLNTFVPVAISVLPKPQLYVDYFLQRDVYSQDPFTDVVEPPVPFALGLRVTNGGYGTATNFTITSAQPQIVDNANGLLINFQIIDSEVGGQPEPVPSLTLDLGNLGPMGSSDSSAVGLWFMTCSLEGEFTNFAASFTHSNALGGLETSVIQGVNIHELNHVVEITYPSDDGILDFLCNDSNTTCNGDAPFVVDALPNDVYSSDGNTYCVTSLTGAQTAGLVTSPSSIITVTDPHDTPTSGFVYFEFEDPSQGQYAIKSVTRMNDGVQLLVGTNVWQTPRRPNMVPPHLENQIHIFDYLIPNSTYRLIAGATDSSQVTYQITYEVPLVVTWNPAPIIYGTALSAAQENATANMAGTFTYTYPIGLVPPAGPYTVSGTFTPSDPSYSETLTAATLSVTPAPLTITAGPYSMAALPLAATLPALPQSCSFSGFVNGDTSASLTTQPTVSFAPNPAANPNVAGSYPFGIGVFGAADPNYDFTYVAGTLIVGPMSWNASSAATAGAGGTATVTLPPGSFPGATAMLNDTAGSQPITVAVATYPSDPMNGQAGDIQFGNGSGFADVKVSGDTTDASLTVDFYSPTMAQQANAPVLSYWNGSTYAPIESPVPTEPAGVFEPSGGGQGNYDYVVVFDNNSLPTLAQLTGTVIVIGVPVAPSITCPTDIQVNQDPGDCGALVTFTGPTATGYPTPTITCELEDGAPVTSPFEFPVGATTVYCTAANVVDTQDCSFTVTVLEKNPPVAGAFSINPKEGAAESIPVAKLLSVDQDPSGGALSIAGVTSPTAKNGRVTLNNGLLTYTPAANYVGTDTIDYVLSDGCGSVPGTISVTVATANAPSVNGLTIQMSGGNVILQFHGIPGQAYYIQSGPAVTGPWTDLPDTPVTANGLGLIGYSTMAPVSTTFYRTSINP